MIRLAFYKGRSLTSRLIKWQSWGQYSHVGVLLEDDSIIEAWQDGGVLHNAHIGMRHSPDTEVDIYEIPKLTKEQSIKAFNFLKEQCGKRYDFLGVARFLSRREVDNKNKWFCSELAAAGLAYAGYPLLNTKPRKISPTVLSWSPLTKHVETVFTKAPDWFTDQMVLTPEIA